MTAESSTPADPRAVSHEVAIEAARTFARGISADMWASIRLATETARVVVNALADAGLLSLPEREAEDDAAEQARVLTEAMAGGVGRADPLHVLVRGNFADAAARAVALLHEAGYGITSLRSGASGTPVETGEVTP